MNNEWKIKNIFNKLMENRLGNGTNKSTKVII